MSRITNRSLAVGSLNNLQASLDRSQRLQEQLSSGKVLRKPSDDPVVTNNSIQYRTEIGVNEQYGRNNLDGQAWLNTADTALKGAVDAMQTIRGLTVQAASTGGNTAESRRAIARQIDSLKEEVLQSANTKYLGRSVFAGTRATDTAFTADTTTTPPTYAYAGNSAAVARRVGPDVDVQVNVPGEEAFGTAGETFAMLTRLSDKLKSGDSTGIGGFLDEIDAGLGRLKDSWSAVGARTNQLTALKDVSDTRIDSLTDSDNEITSVDLPKTLIEYNLQKVAYESALGVTAKVIQPTLMDFLR
ncbi:flagellar hook-associated protein FlgL [Kineococcus siccus]|uniref:flagellar hook-associated protein FlgL n=1 Tax=Kineococcus siccus TaxID=2696567 RepID=UPI001411CC29|nr:flagellar hook-associated protein FlgL [Kineococcus siccus]